MRWRARSPGWPTSRRGATSTSCRPSSTRSMRTRRWGRSATRSPPSSGATSSPRSSEPAEERLMDARLRDAARAAEGFMPDDEGLALHAAGLDGATVGPLLEIGTYCGKSAIYLGAAARARGTICFTVDHHRGSEENQA